MAKLLSKPVSAPLYPEVRNCEIGEVTKRSHRLQRDIIK